jgi:hypothetical protein
MNYINKNGLSNDSGAGEAEETLRLIARLPAPEGLEDRVQAGLVGASRRARVLAWPAASALAGGWLRAAAAAAIVFVVAGGGWGIYSRVQPGRPAHGVAGPHIAGPGEFTEGGAVRRPQTLVGPVVTPPDTAEKPKPKATTRPDATAASSTGSRAVHKAPAPAPAPVVQ